jgi:predicted esterase
VDLPDQGAPRLLVVGFHGYAEQAAVQLERLRAMRETRPWALASVQALHRFYRRDGQTIAAGWMTREDRELMIADNVAYVDAVVAAIAHDVPETVPLVFAGFSQGASMAYRAAALGVRTAAGVIAVGGDLPPDLPADSIRRIGRVLIAAGARDSFYTRQLRERDERCLAEAGVEITTREIDARHEWTTAVSALAAEWLAGLA